MVLVMQSEKRGVKIDPTLVLQGLTPIFSTNSLFNLFYTATYCYFYKVYTQCWPHQIFVHGALQVTKG